MSEKKRINYAEIIGHVLGYVILTFFLFPYLWNNTITELFDIPTINVWDSFKILLISKILFAKNTILRSKKWQK